MLYLGLNSILFLLRYALSGRGLALVQIYYLVLFGLFLFSAFRYQVGCDWSGYYYQYVGAANIDWFSLGIIQEPIWNGILAWINGAGLPYPVVNIASSAVFFAGIHVLAQRQPDPLSFLVLLFPILIINMPMSGIRQGAAIGLICIAFMSFIRRRPIQFALWVLLASGFHRSAFVFILLLPIVSGKYTRGRVMLGALLALPGAYLLASSEVAETALDRYAGTGVEAFGAVFRVGILVLTALYFFLFLRKKWRHTWPQDYSLVSIGALGMGLAAFLLPVSSVIADRFGYYFIPIQAMIFARLPFLPFSKKAALHSAMPYIGLLLVFIVWSQFSFHFQECYLPYRTWIFGFPNGDPTGF